MKIHFIGIGGIGMSALARYGKEHDDFTISGSDLAASAITRALQKEGIAVKIGHGAGNVPKDADLVIYNRAVRRDNPEIAAAKRRGIRTIPYARALGELTRIHTTIAITGSHGKSTTTAMAGLALIRAGLDPTVLVGTTLKEFREKNLHIGNGKRKLLVLEADDFGGAFLHYSPAVAVVTNIDREHLDFYKNFTNLRNAFLKFLGNTRRGGALILNRDDKNVALLRHRIAALAKKKGLRVIWYSLRHGGAKIRRVITIPGEHNVSNALAVLAIGKVFDAPEKKVLAAIHAYKGAWRRMEYRGIFHGAKVFDDYAHHPTEIRATLAAFRQKFPRKKILCVFQPHQAKRLAALFKEFLSAFDGADETLILPLYKVAGRDGAGSGTGNRSAASSQTLVRAIQKKQPRKLLFSLDEPKNLKKALLSLRGPLSSRVIIMMGAGNIVELTDSLVQ